MGAKDHRAFVFRHMFKGTLSHENMMFAKPGYRGVSVLPYPRHVQDMIKRVDNQVKKNSPETKNTIYKGFELQPNIDQKKNETQNSPAQLYSPNKFKKQNS